MPNVTTPSPGHGGNPVPEIRLPGKRTDRDSTPDHLGPSVHRARGDEAPGTGPSGVPSDRLPGKRSEHTPPPGGTPVPDAPGPPTDAEIRRAAAADLTTIVPRWELVSLYRMRVLAERHGLSLNEYAVLAELLLRPRGVSGTEVAEAVGLATGGTTRLLARLEERDLVARDPDPADARRLLVQATAEARALLWDDVTDVDVARLFSGIPTDRVAWATAVAGRFADVGVRRVQALRDRRFRERRRNRGAEEAR